MKKTNNKTAAQANAPADKKTGEKSTLKRQKISTIAASIPYLSFYDDGTIKNKEHQFSRVYGFNDMNFDTESEDTQSGILKEFGKLLNKFNPNVTAQYIIFNRKVSIEDVHDDYFIKSKNDDKQDYRDEYNDIIAARLEQGNNDIQKERYIVLSIVASNYINAEKSFISIEQELNEAFKRVNKVGVHKLTVKERLSLMHDIFRSNQDIEYKKRWEKYCTEDGEFSLRLLNKRHESTKEITCPTNYINKKKYLCLGENLVCKTFYISELPSSLDTRFLSEISNIPCQMITSIIHKTKSKKEALKKIKIHNNSIKGEVVKAQQRAIKNNYDPSMISETLQEAREEGDFLVKDLTINNLKAFFTTVTITIFAENKDKLDEYESILDMKMSDFSCQFIPLVGQQITGFNTSLPFGETYLSADRLLTTEAACAFFPFSVQEIMDKNGHFYGINEVTKNMIMYDRKNSPLPNGLIFGQSGSGKSFITKGEIIPNILDTDDDIIILDPDAEYVTIANQFGGTVINLTKKADVHINPLDMDMEYDSKEADPLAEKCEYMVSLVESIMGRIQLSPYEVATIHRCTAKMYDSYLEHMETLRMSKKPEEASKTCDPDACPTLANFYEELMADGTPEGQSLGTAMYPYCVGEYNLFAHRTTLSGTPRILVYNLKFMPSKMKEMAMKVCLTNIWNRVIQNKAEGRATWVYLDEFYLLCQTEGAANTLWQYYKRIRKYYGIMTGITQDIEDVLVTQQGRGILNNSGFFLMMNQSKIGRAELADHFSISSTLIDYIKDKPPGMGLLYNGQSLIPFNYRVPVESKLYKLMSTKPTDGDYVSVKKDVKDKLRVLLENYKQDGETIENIADKLAPRYDLKPEDMLSVLQSLN